MKKYLWYSTMPREWPRTSKGWRQNGFVLAESHRDAVTKTHCRFEFDDDKLAAEGGTFYCYVAIDDLSNLHPNGMPIKVHEFTLRFTPEQVKVNQ